MPDFSALPRGFYWVKFSWGHWEPAEWTGGPDGDWLRTGIEEEWSDAVAEVGERLEHDPGPTGE